MTDAMFWVGVSPCTTMALCNNAKQVQKTILCTEIKIVCFLKA